MITFLGLIQLCGRTGTFLLYAGLTLVALAFTAVLVPEMKGRSLEEIEEHRAMAHDQIAADRIKKETNGRLEITIYPNRVLGGDTAMIAQTNDVPGKRVLAQIAGQRTDNPTRISRASF
jgi:hypothetical protein